MFIINFRIEMKHENDKDKQISKKNHILPFSFFPKVFLNKVHYLQIFSSSK
jgi:hypothetical protein